MRDYLWIIIPVSLFAILGVASFARSVSTGWKRFVETVNDLTNTLKDAAEIAKAYREDVQILKQIAQSAPTPNFGEETESIIPSHSPVQATMPPPYWGRYPIKPEETDAPAESTGEVDVTATEEELMEQEKNEAAVGFEVTERMKAATRDADQERIKSLMEQSAKPEGQ